MANEDILQASQSVLAIKDSSVEFDNQGGLIMAMLFLESAKARIRALEEAYQALAVKFFDEHPDLKEIEIGSERIIYRSHEKKERFRTETIYNLFQFTPQQQAILEKNPGFRKKELAKAAGMDMKDIEKEFVDIEWTDKVKVKILDKKFISSEVV